MERKIQGGRVWTTGFMSQDRFEQSPLVTVTKLQFP